MQWLFSSQLKSKDPERRIEALRRLSAAQDEKSMAEVIDALSDPVIEVRLAAVRVMAGWGGDYGVRGLGVALRDPESAVRELAIVGLRAANHPEAARTIYPMMCDMSASVRSLAARALDAMGWAPETDAQRALRLVALGKFAKAAEMGAAALDLLMAVLQDASASTRREVADVLAGFPQARVAAALSRALGDADPGVRVAAILSLGRMIDHAKMDSIVRLIGDPDKNVRAAAVDTLGSWRRPEHVPMLVRCLKDPHWMVRAAAAAALSKIGERSVAPALLELLRDEDPDVRCAAVEALGVLREEAAIESLVVTQLDPESGVRQAALMALSRIDPQWARHPSAQKTLPEIKRALRSSNYWVRHVAADLMSKVFNIRQAAPMLSTGPDREARRKAHALDVLVSALWDEDTLVRGAAAEALGRLGERRALDALAARARDAHEWVRRVAEVAVAQLQAMPEEQPVYPQFNMVQDSWGQSAAH